MSIVMMIRMTMVMRNEDDDLGNVLVLSLGEIVHSLNISPVE